MGKILDWIMCDFNWEEMQKIQLMKKAGNSLENLSKKELIKLVENGNK